MEIAQKIEKMRTKHLKDIEVAARNADIATILLLTKDIAEIERLRERYSDIEDSLLAWEENKTNKNNKVISSTETQRVSIIASQTHPSYKAQGKKRRIEFTQAAERKGLRIIPYRGVKFKIGDKLICIPTASGKNPNRWFMGFPPDNYFALVLICEETDGVCVRFILNGEFYAKILKHQSIEGDGQLKFNVHKEGSHYFLKLTGLDKIEIDSFKDNFELLRTL